MSACLECGEEHASHERGQPPPVELAVSRCRHCGAVARVTRPIGSKAGAVFRCPRCLRSNGSAA